MIDYDKADDDSIVQEVRQARERYAARFDYDLKKAFDFLKQQESTTGRRYITTAPLPPLSEIKEDKPKPAGAPGGGMGGMY